MCLLSLSFSLPVLSVCVYVQYHSILSSVAPDILRLLAQTFTDEAPEVRAQPR